METFIGNICLSTLIQHIEELKTKHVEHKDKIESILEVMMENYPRKASVLGLLITILDNQTDGIKLLKLEEDDLRYLDGVLAALIEIANMRHV